MSNYDPVQSRLMMLCSNLCYEQFTEGATNSSYTGAIDQLPTYKANAELFSNYNQINSFKAPEIFFAGNAKLLSTIDEREDFDLADEAALAGIRNGLNDVFFGFTLESKIDKQNILAFRGTQTIDEWLIDATAIQIPVPLFWINGDLKIEGAKMHLGFLIQYAFLLKQVNAGIGQLDKGTPLYITGHSLGAALAVVAATILSFEIDTVRMYNFAGPRVGNIAFTKAYNRRVEDSFRIVNMADIVPVLPPTSIRVLNILLEYAHAGIEISYLWQKNDVSSNHSAANNYTPAVLANIPTDTPPMPDHAVSGR